MMRGETLGTSYSQGQDSAINAKSTFYGRVRVGVKDVISWNVTLPRGSLASSHSGRIYYTERHSKVITAIDRWWFLCSFWLMTIDHRVLSRTDQWNNGINSRPLHLSSDSGVWGFSGPLHLSSNSGVWGVLQPTSSLIKLRGLGGSPAHFISHQTPGFGGFSSPLHLSSNSGVWGVLQPTSSLIKLRGLGVPG